MTARHGMTEKFHRTREGNRPDRGVGTLSLRALLGDNDGIRGINPLFVAAAARSY